MKEKSPLIPHPNFFASWLIANGWWALACFGGIETVSSLWHWMAYRRFLVSTKTSVGSRSNYLAIDARVRNAVLCEIANFQLVKSPRDRRQGEGGG